MLKNPYSIHHSGASYVIGHKNPDTDAICSAIAYADFLQQTTRPDIVAARCGEVNLRTSFVLERAGLEQPQLLMDVRPNASFISNPNVIGAHMNESLFEAYDRMKQNNHRSLPVLGDDGNVVGMLSLIKLVELLLLSSDNLNQAVAVESSLQRICSVLKGEFEHAVEPGREEKLELIVGALSAGAFIEGLKGFDPKALIVVAGDRPTVQLPSIEYGVRAIVVTGKHSISPPLLELAKEKDVSVLISPMDTATTTLLIKCSKRIIHAASTEFMSFNEKTLVKHIQAQVQATSQHLFPVVNESGKVTGVFSKSDLVNPQPTKLVLVDHNEFSQAVTGADEADILEVIDHHRLGGGLSSHEPIRFINEPVGATCTIVAKMYKQTGIIPSRSIALCMAAGIISDTLLLTSPTATSVDKEILTWLEKYTECDLRKFAQEFFSAGSVLEAQSADQVVQADCKEYQENGWKIAVAQVEEQGLDQFWIHKDKLREALKKLNQDKKLHFSCLIVTDITSHYSMLLTAGEKCIIDVIDYPEHEEGLFEMEGVVSRKKQVLPHLMGFLAKIQK